MPKAKEKRIPHYNHHEAPRNSQRGGAGGGAVGKCKKMHTFSRLSSSGKDGSTLHNNNNQQQKRQQQHVRPTIPFGKRDRILLIGEGDFSFARSLAVHHRCKDVLATCYDSKETVHSKYPQAEKNISAFLDAFSRKKKRESGTAEEAEDEGGTEQGRDDGGKGERGEETNNNDDDDGQKRRTRRHGPRVLYSVDARKLGSAAGGGKKVRTGFPRWELRRPAWKRGAAAANPAVASERRPGGGGPWDIICFNFPHVGGLSTDVNRQVRSNQELLVAFFRACVPLLSVPTSHDGEDDDESDFEGYTDSEFSDDNDDDTEGNGVAGAEDDGDARASSTGTRRGEKRRTEPGQILVTLFEGEPYTLWNIRDLARHAGLRVVTSFRFPWTSYPGYSHARTLGEIEGRHGGRGGWRGEEREARTYVFEVKTENYVDAMQTKSRKKRAREGSDSDDSD
ncbi:hypothetical protein VTN00DRAFT_998 [Thermoascus crustaceus]|uniref:uncharacterized protein n=1 Tax=Thermoascus crustaceus TaxID=5088 RepID=UPI003742F34E